MTANLYKIALSLIFAVLFSPSLYAQSPLSVVQIAGGKAQTRTSLEGDNPYSLAYAMFVLNPASKKIGPKPSFRGKMIPRTFGREYHFNH